MEYGTVAALHALVERIGLIQAVNDAAPKRNGIPVGELVAILAINRCLDPFGEAAHPGVVRDHLPAGIDGCGPPFEQRAPDPDAMPELPDGCGADGGGDNPGAEGHGAVPP